MGENQHKAPRAASWAQRAVHAVRAWWAACMARCLPARSSAPAPQPAAPTAPLLQTIQIGDVVEGPVHKISAHWALVDLGTCSGLLHIQDMAWQHIAHPREVLHIGQRLRAKVLEMDAGAQRKRIRLGLKQMQPDPWQGAAQRCPKGTHVQGKVVHIGETGVLLELEPGLQGRIHPTEVDWADKTPDLDARFTVGETVAAVVSKINESGRRLELSTRLLAFNPWSGAAQRYPPGARVRGSVASVKDSVVFIALEPAMQGLLPASEISWRKRIDPHELLAEGDETDCIVLDVNEAAQSMVLSIKRLLPDPWQDAAQRYPAGTRLRGTIRQCEVYGIFVEIMPGLEGLLQLGEMEMDWDAPADVQAALQTRFVPGQSLEVVVLHLNAEKRHMDFSMREPACTADWTGAAQRWPRGTRLRARVRHIVQGYGVFAEVAPGVLGRLPAFAIARNKAHFAVGQTIDVQVFKIEEERHQLVLDLDAARTEEDAKTAAARLQALHVGCIVQGVVKHLTPYGAFVDLGGIDALLHITDMAWQRVRHPGDVVHVGMEVTAKVIKLDAERQRVWLGLKHMQPDPWAGAARRYPQGARLCGKVVKVLDYGVFVEIEPGVEGLIHASSLKQPKRLPSFQTRFAPEQSVEVDILEIDEDKRRIALGIQQANPWPEFAQSVRCGEKIRGPVTSIADYGLFIGLAEGIDGLVHVSDLPQQDGGDDKAALLRHYHKGQEVEAVVLAVDVERERISLGIQQLDAEPPVPACAAHDAALQEK